MVSVSKDLTQRMMQMDFFLSWKHNKAQGQSLCFNAQNTPKGTKYRVCSAFLPYVSPLYVVHHSGLCCTECVLRSTNHCDSQGILALVDGRLFVSLYQSFWRLAAITRSGHPYHRPGVSSG